MHKASVHWVVAKDEIIWIINFQHLIKNMATFETSNVNFISSCRESPCAGHTHSIAKQSLVSSFKLSEYTQQHAC